MEFAASRIYAQAARVNSSLTVNRSKNGPVAPDGHADGGEFIRDAGELLMVERAEGTG